ncbi:MAG: hypothetical protein KC547_04930 [Anaerolineae bacterium]|nr:hypothetical protein [Anaerolineae bacterium]MCA9910013.1 hypothetical protein [Anaerolineae bacterium]
MSNITSAVERISQLKFLKSSEDAFTLDEVTLHMKEFLRRTLLWTKALDATSWPFSIIAIRIDESLELTPELQRLIYDKRVPYPGMVMPLFGYLYWSMVEDSEKVKQMNLPSPYEPVITMFEHGGWYYQENRFLFVLDAKGSQGVVELFPSLYDTDQSFLPSNQS